MWLARYSAAANILSNPSRLVPGAGSPDRYRGATCSSQARWYKAPTVSLIFGSRITRKRHRCMFPPLGAQTPASRIFRINSFGTGSGFRPPHRPGVADDLEKVGGARRFLGHRISFL